MKQAPKRCVIDTNVPVTANGKNEAAMPACVAASARSLQAVMEGGHLFIDGGLIVRECPEIEQKYREKMGG